MHREISQKIVNTLEDEIDMEEVEKPTVDILKELLEKISGEEKLILLLKYKEKWSLKEIALGLSESSVKMRLCRSKEKLQKLLTKYSVSR